MKSSNKRLKMAATTKLLIELNSPSKIYGPRDLVTGRVVVNLSEPLEMRGLRLTLNSLAHFSLDSNDYYNDEVLFETTVTLRGNPPDTRSGVPIPVMQVGRHTFDFSLPIPNRQLPASLLELYQGTNTCWIKYAVRARIDRPTFRFDINAAQEFTIPPFYDLNLDRQASLPQNLSDGKTVCCWCCDSGRIEVLINLPKSGYVAGEVILVKMMIVKTVILTVKHGYYKRTIPQVVAETTEMEPILPGETQRWVNEGLVVPPVSVAVPTISESMCRIIEIVYDVVFDVYPSGCSTSFEVRAPIVIGTVPLMRTPQL